MYKQDGDANENLMLSRSILTVSWTGTAVLLLKLDLTPEASDVQHLTTFTYM
jgi:hypothetical protein